MSFREKFEYLLEANVALGLKDPEIKVEVKVNPDITCAGCPGPKNTALIAILIRFGDKPNPFKE